MKLIKIKKIKRIGKLKTFDISVDKTHNFILKNGLLSHNSQDFTVLGKMPSRRDREEATIQLKADGKISTEQITELGELKQGEYFIIESGKGAKKRYLLLPRCMYWREKYSNFYNEFSNINGSDKFLNIKDKIKEIEKDFKDSEKIIRDEEENKRLEQAEKDSEDKERIRKQDEEDLLQKNIRTREIRKEAKDIVDSDKLLKKKDKKDKKSKKKKIVKKDNIKNEESLDNLNEEDGDFLGELYE